MVGILEVIIGKICFIFLFLLGFKECLFKFFFKDLFYDFCVVVDC